MATFVDDLEQLRAHLDIETFQLLGHSHGGLIALRYTQAHPDRLTSLVLLNSQLAGLPPVPAVPAGRGGPALAPPSPEALEAMAYLQSIGGFGAMMALSSDEEATKFLRRVFPLYFSDFSNATPLEPSLAQRLLPVHTVRRVSASDANHPLDVKLLRALPMPVLVVAAAHDRLCPVPSRRQLAALLTRGRFLLFEESGQFPWLEEPAKFFHEVEEFLADSQRQAVRPVH